MIRAHDNATPLLRYIVCATACASFVASGAPVYQLNPQDLHDTLQAAHGRIEWVSNRGRSGGPALRIDSSAAVRYSFFLFNTPRPFPGSGDYRLETWAKTVAKSCRIELVLYDHRAAKHGKRYALDIAGPRARWQYHARDIALNRDTNPKWYNIRVFVSAGESMLDGLSLKSSPSILANGDFTQRDPLVSAIAAQSKSPGAPILPRGWRRWYESADAGAQADGTYGIEQLDAMPILAVHKGEGEFVLSSEPASLPDGTLNFIARAETDGSSAPPALVMREYGIKGLSMAASSNPSLVDANTISVGPQHPVERAERVLVLLRFPRLPGTYRLRSVTLTCQTRNDPAPVILTDQVGFDSEQPVRFLVSTPAFPKHAGSFRLASRKHVYIGSLLPLGRVEGDNTADWGAYYFEGFVQSAEPGSYRLCVNLNNRHTERNRVTIAPELHVAETAELAYRFYTVQRCGCAVPSWHERCHMDDARLPDGTHVDVSGGYHNAGDYHKHMDDNTPVSVYAMITAYEKNAHFYDALDTDGNGQADLLDEAEWGADWMRKMIDPKTGHSWRNVTNDIDYWGIPERDTDGITGTSDDRVVDTHDPGDFGAWNIAAWAALARHTTATPCLSSAVKLWSACEVNLVASRNPRALIAATELYRTTRDKQYETAAGKIASDLVALQNPEGWFSDQPGGANVFRIVDEGAIPAALALYVLTWPQADAHELVIQSLRRYFAWSLHMADNPFGIIRHRAGGASFYFKSRDDWFGGSNSAYCSTAWAANLASRVFREESAFSSQLHQHAMNQIQWILGMNPLGLCMFEGKGDSHRLRFHHTYSTIPGHERGAVPGAIPNGIIRNPANNDCPWFDLRPNAGSPPGAESAEPWLPHNAYYLLALSALN